MVRHTDRKEEEYNMKKLIALLISALMILSMTAIAETAEDTALIARISNIALDINANGEEQAVNLDGFEAYLSLDTADGVSLIGQAFNGDDPLALAVLKVADGQVQVVIGGVDKTYVIDVEQLKGADLNSMGQEMRAALPGLVNMQIPMIPAISLPKLSISPILGMFGTQEADGSVSFSVPSEMVDTLLDQVLDIAKGSMTSQQAAEKLAGMGYTNVFEFGGINTWTGEIVTTEEESTAKTAVLSFSSFDGGGHEYTVEIEDPTIVTVTSRRDYGDRNELEEDVCCRFFTEHIAV